MRRSTILVVAIAFVLGGALGTVGLLAGHVLKPGSAAVPPPNPVCSNQIASDQPAAVHRTPPASC